MREVRTRAWHGALLAVAALSMTGVTCVPRSPGAFFAKHHRCSERDTRVVRRVSTRDPDWVKVLVRGCGKAQWYLCTRYFGSGTSRGKHCERRGAVSVERPPLSAAQRQRRRRARREMLPRQRRIDAQHKLAPPLEPSPSSTGPGS